LLGAALPHRADAEHHLALSRCSLPICLAPCGVTLPRPLQDGRCALTAPFHPYPGAGVFATASAPGKPGQLGYCVSRWPSDRIRRTGRGSRGGIFSVALAVRDFKPRPDVIRHTTLRSSDFPPRKPGFPSPRQRPPSPPASPSVPRIQFYRARAVPSVVSAHCPDCCPNLI